MEGVARENDLNQAVEVRKADAFEAVFADQEFADEFGNRRPALTSSVIDDVKYLVLNKSIYNMRDNTLCTVSSVIFL